MAAWICLNCERLETSSLGPDCCENLELICINDMPGEIRRLRKWLAEASQQAPQAAPTKLPIPPAQADMLDVAFAEGWNQCCDTFFGGLPAQEPVVITIEHHALPLSDEEILSAGRCPNGLHPWGVGTTRADFLRAARAIERAHGIKGD